ncbi:Sarcoplasmic calcium-binding protein 1, partial [Cyphomyrmex costatus]
RKALLFYFNFKKFAAERHRLVEAYGEHALSETTCRDLFRRFKNNDFDVNDKEWPGQQKKLLLLQRQKRKSFLHQIVAMKNGFNVKKPSMVNTTDVNDVVTIEEFKKAMQSSCVGRSYNDFPQAMKMFIDSHFKILDINEDGVIGAEEFRYDCASRIAVDNIDILDKAFQSLLNDDDRKRGGLTLSRYQELYAQFLGNPDDNCPAIYLFGPIGQES